MCVVLCRGLRFVRFELCGGVSRLGDCSAACQLNCSFVVLGSRSLNRVVYGAETAIPFNSNVMAFFVPPWLDLAPVIV